MFAVLLVGCASNSTPDAQGPTKLRLSHVELDDRYGDPELRAEIVDSLAALRVRLRDIAPLDEFEPIEVKLFATRSKMASWARAEGISAFENIDRGGISGDFGAALYYVGDHDTLRLARHEYVHQYLRQNTDKQLPPFVEEGVATMLDGGADTARIELLRELEVVAPIGDLIGTHAGQLGNRSMAERSAWYAQAWAFAEFIERRYPDYWRTYFTRAGGFAALLTERAKLDWPGIESAYQVFVREELID